MFYVASDVCGRAVRAPTKNMNRFLILLLFTFFGLVSVSFAQTKYLGEYETNYGTVKITRAAKAHAINFIFDIATENGCEGDLRGVAKLTRGANFFVWEAKLGAKENYGKNARYRLEFTFLRNKVIVKERSIGTNRAVTIYHGVMCTFNGTYRKK
jgi:hypothetical protein